MADSLAGTMLKTSSALLERRKISFGLMFSALKLLATFVFCAALLLSVCCKRSMLATKDGAEALLMDTIVNVIANSAPIVITYAPWWINGFFFLKSMSESCLL